MARRKTVTTEVVDPLARIVEDLRPLALPIGGLKPDPGNPRTHDDRNIEAIAASLRTFGQVKPLVVDAGTGEVVAGNGTLAAAKRLGWTHLAAVRIKMDPAGRRGLSVADNRTAELAGWDEEILAAAAEAIREENPDLFAELFLEELVAAREADDRSADGSEIEAAAGRFEVVVDAGTAAAQRQLYDRLTAEGWDCRLLSS
ncbi:MAG: ParB/Srx family N-terminal domain-containing protein [Elusimicrobia bacterium]|nr:ParB/Srx family N-terminal domain-containing protein [Elusimicrobiota bacterium]